MKVSELKKTRMCPECMCISATLQNDDNDNNMARLKEQIEIRGKDVAFNFRFRLTCSNCGHVFLNKIIKNVKLTRT